MNTTWVHTPTDLKNMEKVYKDKDRENVIIYKSHYSFDVFRNGRLIARVRVGKDEK